MIDERMGIRALRYPVPEHANSLGWSLGGLTAVSLVVLIVTGVILVQFYIPDPTQANQSVRDISTNVVGGAFVRGLHYWAAQAMYVLAALHLLRVFLTASYKKPREGNWLIGVAMFALTFLAIFTVPCSSGTRRGSRPWSITSMWLSSSAARAFGSRRVWPRTPRSSTGSTQPMWS